jgi:hypothetical protein
MYKNSVFICEIYNASCLNSEEPCVKDGIEANQCLENCSRQLCEYQGYHLVEDDNEEEEQLQLLNENEGSSFNWKTPLLLGLGAAAFTAGIML